MIFAQITDTHVRAGGKLVLGAVDTADRLRRCVDHLMRLDPPPEAVIVTGDLVERGEPEEYRTLRDILAPLGGRPIYVIPGNHDERRAFRAAFADLNYLPAEGEFLHYVVETHPLRLIGLDTTVPGKPWGEMCNARLDWLDRHLAEAPDRPTLIFMHHPPFLTGIPGMDWQNCRNGDALGALIARHRQVVRVLCGHVHRAITVPWHGLTATIGPSTAHAVALEMRAEGSFDFVLEPPACQLHIWNADTGLVSHVTYVGDYGERRPFERKKAKAAV